MHNPWHAEVLSLVLVAGMLSGSPLAGADPGEQETPSAAGQAPGATLADALTAQGWTRVEGADGSVIYRVPVAPEQGAVDTSRTEHSLADQLRGQLEAQGWTAMPAEGGGFYYLPPPPAAPAGSTLAERLREQLESQGWTGIQADDGSIVYHPPGLPEQSPSQGGVGKGTLAERLRQQLEAQGWTATPAEGGGVYYLPPPPAAPAGSTLAERLREQLESQGWTGSQADDGSIVYHPPGLPEQSPAQGGVGKGTLAERLRQTLEAQGWIATPAEDGGVYYMPPSAVSTEAPVPGQGPGSQQEPGSETPAAESAVSPRPATVPAGDEVRDAPADSGAPGRPAEDEVPPEPQAAAVDAPQPGDGGRSSSEMPASSPGGSEFGHRALPSGRPFAPWMAPGRSPYPGHRYYSQPSPKSESYNAPPAWAGTQRPAAPAWRPYPWGHPPAGPYYR